MHETGNRPHAGSIDDILSQRGAVQPSDVYHRFGRSLFEILGKGEEVSVITFNYDVALDFALAVHFPRIDYCFEPEPQLGEGVIQLMKLHGSINWGTCTKCNQIEVQPIHDYIHSLDLTTIAPTNKNWNPVHLEMAKALSKTQHAPCQARYEIDPVVVPPTTSKVDYQKTLDKVWRRAGRHLSEADSIYVVGYSWPAGDQFFHQLYAVGSVGTQLLKRFCVINPDQAVRDRIKNELLGQQAADRFELLADPTRGFDPAAVDGIREHYRLPSLGGMSPRTRRGG